MLALLFVCAAAGLGCSAKGGEQAAPPAPYVKVEFPTLETFQDFEEFTGKTEPIYSVDIKARATGHLIAVHFKDGDMVKKGDLLFEIDPRPYLADLARSKAALVQIQVRVKRLEKDHARGVDLVARNSMSREEFDKISGDLDEARANIDVAKANLQTAEYNLAWTKVHADISGRISKRRVDPGNLIKTEETLLSNIVTEGPNMYASFDVDERTMLKLDSLRSKGKLYLSQDRKLKLEIGLANDPGYTIQAETNFIENKIDTGTGTLRVRGIFDNTGIMLRPGLFVRIRLPIGESRQALTIPEKALGTDQGQKYIYIVDAEKKVVYRSVKLGPLLEGGKRVVEEGVKEGDMVIASGLQRVRPKFVVDPKTPAEWDAMEKAKASAQAK